MQRDRLLQNKIHQAFRRSEHQLLKALQARKAEVKVRHLMIMNPKQIFSLHMMRLLVQFFLKMWL